MRESVPMQDRTSVHKSREEFMALLDSPSASGRAGNFFLSPAWARRYVSRWPKDDFFIGMQLRGEAGRAEGDATSMLCLSRGIRSSPLSRRHRSLGFNESSSQELADVTTEVNGLIGHPELRFEDWIAAILRQLLIVGGWEELRINALSSREAARLTRDARELGLMCHEFSQDLTYWVDFEQIRTQHAGSYIASRSANTREQLRRALKGLRNRHGDLNLAAASSAAQGHQWLEALAELHKKRWNAHGEAKGFVNTHFGLFHRELSQDMLQGGEIEILRASVGDHALAYLYNYVADGRVYFSMSGVEHERFASFKPGILAHWQAIEFYMAKGQRIYDFQTGTSQYKQSLATHREDRVSVLVRKPLLRFRIEAAARWAKRHLPGAGQRSSIERPG